MLYLGQHNENNYTHQKSFATLDGEIVNPEISVKLEMRDELKVRRAQA